MPLWKSLFEALMGWESLLLTLAMPRRFIVPLWEGEAAIGPLVVRSLA